MSSAARVLALACLTLLARPAAAGLPASPADALAARVLSAPPAQRSKLLSEGAVATAEVARALLATGDKELAGNKAAGALRAFQAAEAVARRAHSDVDLVRALASQGLALGALGRVRDGTKLTDEVLALYERLGDKAGLAEAWNGFGNGSMYLAENAAALDAYQKAHDLWLALGDRRGVARALNNLANVRRSLGDLDDALRNYEQALPVFEEVGDRLSAAVVTNNIGVLHFERGEYARALKQCLLSLSMLEALQPDEGQLWGARYRIGGTLSAVGMIQLALGDYARALEYQHRALEVRQRFGDKLAVMESWNNIGLVHFSQGGYALAADCFKRGLGLSPDSGGESLAAEALGNLGAATLRLGQRERAAANYRASLRIAEREGYKSIAARDLHDLGRMAFDEQRYVEAGRLLARALTIREGLKDQAGAAQALTSLASLRLVSAPAEALSLAQRAIEIARAIEQPEIHWEAETVAGIAERRLGQPDAARHSFEEAVRVIEGLRLHVAGREEGAVTFLDRRLSPYRELVALALARGATAEALELAEHAKARVLGDLVRGRGDVRGTMSDEERRGEDRVRGALVSLNAKILAERQKERPDAALLAVLEGERQTGRLAYESFQTAVQARHPELALLRGHAAPFAYAQAAALIADERTALLEYVVMEEESHLFVLTREAGAVELRSYPLGAGRRGLAPRARQLRERIAARDLSFAEEARALHRALLYPARARLGGKTRLVIVPDGPLWEVPFQALTDSAGHYVIETAAVSYVPSLTVLRESLRPRREGPSTVLAMGKSDFAAKGPRPALSLMSDLGPLPDAERQVREIAALYGPGRSTAYLGADAREDRFKAEAPRYSILHLATHGTLDETSPLYSHVVLSPGASGSSKDGLLEAWEIMDLRLDADLMILSACETGRGRIAPGEGMVGMTWAAFVAGARALVASQWKVEATSTTQLMTAFHRGLARGETDKARQLRQASLEVLRGGRYAHPFYWAGFVLVGNPY